MQCSNYGSKLLFWLRFFFLFLPIMVFLLSLFCFFCFFLSEAPQSITEFGYGVGGSYLPTAS